MNLESPSLCGWLVQTSEPEPEKGSNKRLGMALPRSIRVLQVARSLCCRHPPPMAAMGQRSTAVEPGPVLESALAAGAPAASHRSNRTK